MSGLQRKAEMVEEVAHIMGQQLSDVKAQLERWEDMSRSLQEVMNRFTGQFGSIGDSSSTRGI